MPDIDEDELLADLGLELTPPKASSRTPREERIIAGFEDIVRFHRAHGRAPLHGEERDIFERLYAVRLDQLRKLPEAQTLLAGLDGPGLLLGAAAAQADSDDLDEDALLAELGMGMNVGNEAADPNDITVLRHVRSTVEKRAAKEIADRTPCADFEAFQPLFEQVERDLKAGVRKTLRFGRDTSIAGSLRMWPTWVRPSRRPMAKAMRVCGSFMPTAPRATCCAAHSRGRCTRTTRAAA